MVWFLSLTQDCQFCLNNPFLIWIQQGISDKDLSILPDQVVPSKVNQLKVKSLITKREKYVWND